jgi:hypothetical protein
MHKLLEFVHEQIDPRPRVPDHLRQRVLKIAFGRYPVSIYIDAAVCVAFLNFPK